MPDNNANSELPNDDIQAIANSLLEQLPGLVHRLMRESIGAQFIDADDMIQDIRAAFLDSLSTFEQRRESLEASLRALLATIARHKVADRFRRLKNVIPSVEIEILNNAKAIGETPSRSASRKETHDALFRALLSLDPVDQEIIRLRFDEKRSFHDIAERIGLMIGQSDGRFRRALACLREALGSSGCYQFADSSR